MSRRINEKMKPLQKLENSITEIVIAEDSALKPYIQSFRYEPENITRQPLGSLLGIFEIEDRSQDSAYIVNFLASVAKKEYFSHPKRPAIESLEATLHKINLALSELIKHDNTAWLGNLNALVCVLEKNNLHFSVSGKAKALLIRNGSLTDISEELDQDAELHPLKTFTEVSSGRLRNGDKVILTTPELFEIFPPREIQRNAQRFLKEEFARCVKTALVNSLPLVGAMIVDVFEAPLKKNQTKKQKVVPEIINAFSQSAFSEAKVNKNSFSETNFSDSERKNKEILEEESKEYTDSKTGHIYVQGDIPEIKENETWLHIQWLIEEQFTRLKTFSQKTAKKSWGRIHYFLQSSLQTAWESTQKLFEKEYLASLKESVPVHILKSPRLQEASKKFPSQQKESQHTPKTSSETLFFENQTSFSEPSLPFLVKMQQSLIRLGNQVYGVYLKCSDLVRRIFHSFTIQQKIYVMIGLIFLVGLLFAVPFFNTPKDSSSSEIPKQPETTIKPALSDDKNIHFLSPPETFFIHEKPLVGSILLHGDLFVADEKTIISLKNPQKPAYFPLPEDSGHIIKIAPMEDLGSIFLLTDTDILLSFTPSNQVFLKNTIDLPATADIADMDTYLTYLYILDSKESTIYRYPRIDGGFGEKTAWLKEKISISAENSMAINEDLYLAQKNSLTALSRGKINPWQFESSATPIEFSGIFTNSTTASVYILDTTNKRVIQFEKDGKLQQQYTHEKLGSASNFIVDEKNRTIYFTVNMEVLAISVE